MNDEINILDVYYFFKKRWKLLVIFPICMSAFVFIVTLFMPRIYRSEAIILPLGGESGNILSSLSGFVSGGQLSATASKGNLMMTLLSSRTFYERLERRFDLRKSAVNKLHNTNPEKSEGIAKKQIETLANDKKISWEMTTMTHPTNGTLIIGVESRDPRLSALLVNGILDELQHYLDDNAFTDAKRYRLFIAQQLTQNRKELLEAGKELADYFKLNRISSTNPRLDADVGIADIVGVTAESQVPRDFEQILRKTEHLQNKKEEIESKFKDKIVVKDVPQQVYLEYLNAKRTILSNLNNLLSQHYELAKIEEEKRDIAFQVIDPGIETADPYKPKTKKMVFLSLLMSFVMVVFGLLIVQYFNRLKAMHK